MIWHTILALKILIPVFYFYDFHSIVFLHGFSQILIQMHCFTKPNDARNVFLILTRIVALFLHSEVLDISLVCIWHLKSQPPYIFSNFGCTISFHGIDSKKYQDTKHFQCSFLVYFILPVYFLYCIQYFFYYVRVFIVIFHMFHSLIQLKVLNI